MPSSHGAGTSVGWLFLAGSGLHCAAGGLPSQRLLCVRHPCCPYAPGQSREFSFEGADLNLVPVESAAIGTT